MKRFFLITLLSSLFLAGCGPGKFLGPTLTPTPTRTFTPTSTFTQTVTPSPTPTSTSTSTPTPAYLNILPALTSVASGEGFPGAAVYDPKLPGPHPVVILTTSGTAYTDVKETHRGIVYTDWNDYLPSGWSPASLSETEILVLISPERKIERATTRYDKGPPVTSYQYESDVEIREARTGRTLYTFTYKGNYTMAPDYASYDLREVHGSRLTYAYLETWICSVIIHQGCWKIERILAHYTFDVISLAFSPDGLSLASGSSDATIWEVASGKKLHTFDDTSSAHDIVAFSPDGRTLATGGPWDEGISLYDTASGELKQTLTGHTEPVNSIAWSPDGSSIASGSNDDTVILWDVASGEKLHTLTDHHDDVRSVDFSPDGRTLASGGWDGTVILWDVASGEKTQIHIGPGGFVEDIAFSPDGRTLASNMYGALVLWDVASGKLRQSLPESSYDIAFSPDGSILATGTYDGAIILWDIASGTRAHTLPASEICLHPAEAYVKSLAFSPDGYKLASGMSDGRIVIWSLTIPKP